MLPVPTNSSKFPALPAVEAPEAKYNAPDEPELVVPVRNLSNPLTPEVPALTVATVNAPLVVCVLIPEANDIAPPVELEAPPEFIRMSPPAATSPVPTDMITSPLLPFVAVPVPIIMAPDDPELVVPV